VPPNVDGFEKKADHTLDISCVGDVLVAHEQSIREAVAQPERHSGAESPCGGPKRRALGRYSGDERSQLLQQHSRARNYAR
jgi:hypothetical protein